MSSVKEPTAPKKRVQRNTGARPNVSQTRGRMTEVRSDSSNQQRRNDPRQAVREALDEEMRSRPTTVWQAFWESFKRA